VILPWSTQLIDAYKDFVLSIRSGEAELAKQALANVNNQYEIDRVAPNLRMRTEDLRSRIDRMGDRVPPGTRQKLEKTLADLSRLETMAVSGTAYSLTKIISATKRIDKAVGDMSESLS